MASDVNPEMSTPTSAITLMAPSFTAVPPTIPAEATPTESASLNARSQPSAICERQELWLQRNMTLCLYIGPQVRCGFSTTCSSEVDGLVSSPAMAAIAREEKLL